MRPFSTPSAVTTRATDGEGQSKSGQAKRRLGPKPATLSRTPRAHSGPGKARKPVGRGKSTHSMTADSNDRRAPARLIVDKWHRIGLLSASHPPEKLASPRPCAAGQEPEADGSVSC